MSMKRFSIVALVVAAGLAASLARGAATASVPSAQLRGYVCQTARDPANRGIIITAVMRPLAHTQRLSLRFDLLERQHKHGPTAAVHFGDLGTWIYPKNKTLGQRPGDVWIVHHPVAQLQVAPAYYRFKVSFRWLGGHSHVIGTAVRYSPTCFEPELRPDLQVLAIHIKPSPTNPKRDLYSAVIRNAGASSTGQSFGVEITDGSKSETRTVPAAGRPREDHGHVRRPALQHARAADRHRRSERTDRRLQPRQQLAHGDVPSVTTAAARLNRAMKTSIHPEYVEAHVRCTCGNEFTTRSTKEEIHVEICSACHPFYTGRQKLVDTGGRVERFQRRVAKGRRTAKAPTGA